MWSITWLFPFTLSLSPINLVVLWALSWLHFTITISASLNVFYNKATHLPIGNVWPINLNLSKIIRTITIKPIILYPIPQITRFKCKTVNLVNTLVWSKGMLSVNGRSHVIRYVLTLRIFSAAKKLRFWQNPKKVLNQLNSANWAELHKSHVQRSRVRSRARVTGWAHVQGSRGEGLRAKGMRVAWRDLHLQMGGVQQLKVKCRCQFVLKLKANKSYQELFYFLSSYINLLNLLKLQGLRGYAKQLTYY